MLSNLLRDDYRREWSNLLEYLTPQIFEVVPTLDLAKITARLGQNFAKRHHEQEEAGIRALIRNLHLPVDFRSDKDSSEMLPSLSRRERGEIVLTLFFAQLLTQKAAWLDLREQAFELLSKEMLWQPKAWIFQWDPEFINGIRKIYAGLFLEQSEQFKEGLEDIQLGHAADIIAEHIGAISQQPRRFYLKDLRNVLHKVFVSCKEAKTRLHANFFPYGLLMGGLYQHLESLGASLDVHACFMRAWDRLTAEERSHFEMRTWAENTTA